MDQLAPAQESRVIGVSNTAAVDVFFFKWEAISRYIKGNRRLPLLQKDFQYIAYIRNPNTTYRR